MNRRLIVLLVALLLVALAVRARVSQDDVALAAQWLRTRPLAELWAALAFALAALAFVPVTLLILQTGFLFGPVGILVSLAAITASASVGFLIGRRTGSRWPFFERHAVFAIAAFRSLPLAPFTVTNIAAGASTCRFTVFMAGSLLGMLPGVVLLSVFGQGIYELVVLMLSR